MISSSNTSSEIMSSSNLYEDGSTELRRGPWTLEEDNLLIQYITCHGEGRWNSLAKCAGLKRTGKSCRLRWLNYLKPDIKRGNLSPHEQLLILELHSKWGNRWSKIAQHLPGRTDNEIKNYWRTRVQKQARQLKVDSNSKKFLEAIRMYWFPRLHEKMEQNSSQRTISSPSSSISTQKFTATPSVIINYQAPLDLVNSSESEMTNSNSSLEITPDKIPAGFLTPPGGKDLYANIKSHEHDSYHVDIINPGDDGMQELMEYPQVEISSSSGCDVAEVDWFGEDLGSCSFWNSDDYLWQFRKPEEVFGV